MLLLAGDHCRTHEDSRQSEGGEAELMFDSPTISRQLTEAGIERSRADVLADAIRQAAEHGERVTPESLRAEVVKLYSASLLQNSLGHSKEFKI